MSKEKIFDLWLSEGIEKKTDRFEEIFESLKRIIKKEYKTKTSFKNSFKNLDLKKILNYSEYEEVEKKIDDVFKYIPLHKKRIIYKKETKFYRVFPNEDISFFEFYKETGFYINPYQKLGRFNDEEMKLLYVSTCAKTALNECNRGKDIEKFLLVTYINSENLNLSGIDGENPYGDDNYFQFSFEKNLELLNFDSTYLNKNERNMLYRITNLWRKKFFDLESNTDGFLLKSSCEKCENPLCESLNISLKGGSDKKLIPINIKVVQGDIIKEEYLVEKDFSIRLIKKFRN